uniref:Eisenstasin I n=1 Tax=Eisenia andrei TaxID=168636 RepID=Q5D2M9_9ANNE|nr:eisenstasin I [Eisenia andrei]
MEKSVILVSLVLVVTFFQVTEQGRTGGHRGRHNRLSDSSNATTGCSRVRCWKECTHGFLNDSRGCQVCACARDPNAESCSAIECTLECSDGFVTNREGCEICLCKRATHRRRSCRRRSRCRNECAFGRATDSRGCPSCTCNPQPVETEDGEEPTLP